MHTWAVKSRASSSSKSFTVSQPESGWAHQRQRSPDISTHQTFSPIAHDFAHVGVHAPAGVIQKKPTIGHTGDEGEREADRVAEQVMRDAEGGHPSACTCGTCAHCQKTQSGLAHARVQITRSAVRDASSVDVPAIASEAMESPGRPLDPSTREFMETRFGFDFS